MSATALRSPMAAQRSPTTNEDVTCGHQGALGWTIHLRGNLVRIVLDGELDTATAPALGVSVRPLAEACRTDLVVDLAGLQFCDCSGLALFLRWRSWTAVTGGSLCLVAPSRIVHRLLTVTGTLDLMTLPDRGR